VDHQIFVDFTTYHVALYYNLPDNKILMEHINPPSLSGIIGGVCWKESVKRSE